MEDVKTVSVITGERKAYLIRRWNLPSRNTNFTGREGLLDQISERLSGSKPLVITACHGLGGVGKTQLVTEYAYRNENKYDRVLWIPSESTEQIETAFLLLGQDLGIISEKTPPAEAIHMVKDWLSSHPKNLIIFDNAENYEAIQNYVLPSGADILITSRHTVWPEKSIEVDLFSLEEAVLYFRKIVGERAGDSKEKIEELAEELGRLPLALAQAAAYIRQNKISIQTYIDLYQEKKGYLLSLSVLPESEYHATVFVTWDITMERIKTESASAQELLAICSYLHSEKIPAFLLAQYQAYGRETFEEVRGCLRNYSMVSVDDAEGDVSVHRLVQEVTKLKLSAAEKKRWAAVIFDLFCKVFPQGDDKDKSEDIQVMRALLLHIEALSPVVEDPEVLRAVLSMMQRVHYFLGNARKRRDLIEREIHILDTCFTADPLQVMTARMLKIRALNSLANAVGDLGDNARKILLLKQIIAMVMSDTHNPDHPYIITAEINLGNAYRAVGNIRECRETLQHVLAVYRRNLPPMHPLIAKTLNSLGSAYDGKGEDAEKQVGYFEEALKINKVVYGDDHMEVAIVLNSLANAYGNLGQIRKKIALLEQSLKIKEKHFGKEHPHVAITLQNLAVAYLELKEFERAYEFAYHAYEMFRKHGDAGEEHPDTRAVGRLLEEIKFKRSVQATAPALWQTENKTAEDHLRLAVKYRSEKKHHESIVCIDMALALSPEHPAATFQKARYLFEQENYSEALIFIDTSLAHERNEERKVVATELREKICSAKQQTMHSQAEGKACKK